MKSPTCLGLLLGVLVGADALCEPQVSEAETASGAAGIEAVEVVGRAVARGSVVIDQNFTGNEVWQSNVEEAVTLEGSFNQAGGLISVNQSAGNLDAQANVRLIIVGEGQSEGPVVTVVRSAVTAARIESLAVAREVRIHDSFNQAAGLVGINQSAGSLNQQVNIAVLALGVLVGPEAIAVGDTSLRNVNAQIANDADGSPRTPRGNALAQSFQGFQGIAQVQQAAGNGNSTANVLGFSVSTVTIP